MRRWLLLMFVIEFAGNTVAAAELSPFLKNHQLGLEVSSIGLPETLPKDLVSGLTNTLLIRIVLGTGSHQLARSTAFASAKYDLWEETFTVVVTVNGNVVETKKARTVPEVQAFLGTLRLPDLFPEGDIPKDGSAKLTVEMLLNPIERQRLEAIKKWVAENGTYTPADTSGFSDKRVASSRSNAVFNRIFDQYAQGADVAAIWKETALSKPLKIEEVRVEQ